jgi:RNA polymerase sigma-70 factor (ECF subfamily)
MREIKSFSGEEHIKAWLIRVTMNACKDYFRSSRYRNTVAFTEENLLSGNDTESSLDLEDRQVFEELKKLPAKYRNVIYLYYMEEYSVPEIAKILASNENTVNSWLRRARKKLKMNMEGDSPYEQGSLYCGNAKN